MALDERHRTSIHQALVPLAGEDTADAMPSHFPARGVEEPVTREHLDRRLAELRGEIEEVRTEVERRTNALTVRVSALLTAAMVIVGLSRADLGSHSGDGTVSGRS